MILERLNNGQYGVAKWFYDFFEAKLEGVDTDSIEAKLQCLQKILDVLTEYELFEATRLIFNHERGKEDIEYRLSTTDNGAFSLFEFIRSNSIEMKVCTEIDCSGRSVIYGVNQKEVVSGVFVILYSGMGIRIMTDSDVWLEYDLEGKPQQEIAALNASRLKSALEEIEKRLGFEPVYDHSKYAYVHKYELKNYFENDGTPQAVI